MTKNTASEFKGLNQANTGPRENDKIDIKMKHFILDGNSSFPASELPLVSVMSGDFRILLLRMEEAPSSFLTSCCFLSLVS